MKTYVIETRIKAVHGFQLWEVDAESQEAAKEAFKAGGGRFVDEEVEVTQIEEPTVLHERSCL